MIVNEDFEFHIPNKTKKMLQLLSQKNLQNQKIYHHINSNKRKKKNSLLKVFI